MISPINGARVFFIMLLLFAATGSPGFAQEEFNAEQIIQKAIATYDEINSYEYLWIAEGMDTYLKDQQRNVASENAGLAKKAGVNNEVDDEPKFVSGQYEVKFMKPYISQMKVIKSDLTPKYVWGFTITYRSDKNKDVWWAKPKYSPIALKRSVQDDDAGGAISNNWSIEMLTLQYYVENAYSITLQPEDEFDGKKCYVVRLVFDWNKRPEWTRKEPPFEKYGIPPSIKNIVWGNYHDYEEQKYSHIDYYFDKRDFILVNIEQYRSNEFHWRNSYKNIVINKLSDKDF